MKRTIPQIKIRHGCTLWRWNMIHRENAYHISTTVRMQQALLLSSSFFASLSSSGARHQWQHPHAFRHGRVGMSLTWLEHQTVTPLNQVWFQIAGAARDFFQESTFSADSLTCVCTPPCAIACINICAHVIDPVVHVRVRWIMVTLKTPSMHSRLDSLTLLQLAFPRESNPYFPWEKSHWDNTVVKSIKKKSKAQIPLNSALFFKAGNFLRTFLTTLVCNIAIHQNDGCSFWQTRDNQNGFHFWYTVRNCFPVSTIATNIKNFFNSIPFGWFLFSTVQTTMCWLQSQLNFMKSWIFYTLRVAHLHKFNSAIYKTFNIQNPYTFSSNFWQNQRFRMSKPVGKGVTTRNIILFVKFNFPDLHTGMRLPCSLVMNRILLCWITCLTTTGIHKLICVHTKKTKFWCIWPKTLHPPLLF